MTAVAEIHIDRLKDVLSLPVQAVVQMDGETWCYVDNGKGVEKRLVGLGRNNDKFVQILSGIEQADRAVLNPLAIASLETGERKSISPDSGIAGIGPASPPTLIEDVAEAELQEAEASDQTFRSTGKEATLDSSPDLPAA